MLGLIVNEKEVCNKALETNKIEGKPMKTIRLIIKKFLSENKDKEYIVNKCLELIKCNTIEGVFNKSYWNKVIDSSIGTISKYKNLNLIDVDKIKVYKEELQCIEILNDTKLEKLAFILLIYAKINNIINNNKDNRVSIKNSYIFKESCIKEDKLLLNKLVNLKYILVSSTCDSTTIRVNYIHEDSEVGIIVDNLKDKNSITYYLEYRYNKKYKTCTNGYCETRFELKSNNSKQIYCSKCAKYINKQKTLENYYKNK